MKIDWLLIDYHVILDTVELGQYPHNLKKFEDLISEILPVLTIAYIHSTYSHKVTLQPPNR